MPKKGKPKSSFNQLRIPIVQVDPRHGSKLELYSQDFCDERTWWTTSSGLNDVALVDTGDGLTWDLPAPNQGSTIIDLCHGRVEAEDKLVGTYGATVTVSGVELNEHLPDETFSYTVSGLEQHDHSLGTQDYGIDYDTGQVIFKESQAGKDVRITCHVATTSTWRIIPDTDKRIELIYAELQFARDSIMRGDFVYTMYGKVGRDPRLNALWDENPDGPAGPYPQDTVVPMNEVRYKNKKDLFVAATGALPILQADPQQPSGGWTWRQNPEDVEIYRWDYKEQAFIDLRDSWGNFIDVQISNHQAADGHMAVVTFYGRSDSEEL